MHTDQLPNGGKFKVINLGENCSSRAVLERYGIKEESFPFDSVITPIDSLLQCLRDDFANFVTPEHFKLYFDKHSPVNKYGIVLAHSFPIIDLQDNTPQLTCEQIFKMSGMVPYDVKHTLEHDKVQRPRQMISPKWREILPEVAEKYRRRITRMRECCQGEGKVYFFRCNDLSKETAIQLVSILDRLYPRLNYTVIAVCNRPDSVCEKWNIPKVKNYVVNVHNQGDTEWHRIFQDSISIPIL